MPKRRFTNYTHNWENAPHLARFAMASIDPYMDDGAQDRAIKAGFRTFRIVSSESEMRDDEIMCPAPRTDCESCCLCDGKQGKNDNRKNIAEIAH